MTILSIFIQNNDMNEKKIIHKEKWVENGQKISRMKRWWENGHKRYDYYYNER